MSEHYTYLDGKLKGERRDRISTKITSFPSIVDTDEGKVFAELIENPHHLYIFGAGHVSKALYDQANMLDLSVTVIDDRDVFLTEDRFKNALRLCTSAYEGTVAAFTFSKEDYVVIMTRGHKDDYRVLKAVLLSQDQPGYIGMIGSRGKVGYVKDHLKEEGVPQSLIDSVHAPIGLPFDTETPQEIALSIMAEIYTKAHTKGVSRIEKATLQALENEKDAVEVIIIEKHGSAPRNVGTRMIVKENSTIGTIGGGAIEQAAIHEARLLLKGEERVKIKDYSLESTTASNLGMVCGGDVKLALVRL